MPPCLAKPINNGVMKTRTKKVIGAKAGIEQLRVLANIESMNAEFIRMGLSQSERLKKLIAISRLQTLIGHTGIKKLT
jgi:hypothetical protein